MVQCAQHELCNKCLCDTESPPKCTVALLRLKQSHLRSNITALPRTVALVVYRHICDKTSAGGQVMTGLGILMTKVSACHALYNFQATAQPGTFSGLNCNEVVPHHSGRVNSQESPPSAGAISTAPACLGTSCCLRCNCPNQCSSTTAHLGRVSVWLRHLLCNS
jgi:hypothetical protein